VAERSTRPYLIRALHQWALDSGFTPQIAVDVMQPGVEVPAGYAHDGQIVLNIHPQAVHELDLGNESITFSARFDSRSEYINVPVKAVLAIFARENGRGIQFPPGDEGTEPPPTSVTDDGSPTTKKGSHLKVVK
jgi:stringent starvation protein B